MREDYEITIIGRQTIDAQTDEIQVDTLGDYTERGGAKYISTRNMPMKRRITVSSKCSKSKMRIPSPC